MAFNIAPLTLLLHVLNFVAPAIFIAAVLTLLAPWLWKGSAGKLNWRWRFAILSVTGVAVLVAGLAWTGADGSMATYLTLALAMGTVQWVMGKKG